MSPPLVPNNDNRPDGDAKDSADALARHLDQACKRYRAETDGDLWGFTVDAQVFLAQWLGLSQPELTREFFLALADQAGAQNNPALGIANARVIAAQATLLNALRARRAS